MIISTYTINHGRNSNRRVIVVPTFAQHVPIKAVQQCTESQFSHFPLSPSPFHPSAIRKPIFRTKLCGYRAASLRLILIILLIFLLLLFFVSFIFNISIRCARLNTTSDWLSTSSNMIMPLGGTEVRQECSRRSSPMAFSCTWY